MVLTEQSRQILLSKFRDIIPADWMVYGHHMTINMGNAEAGPLAQSTFEIGQSAELTIITYAYDTLVMAAGIDSEIPSTNAVKHITLAVNKTEGGKPFYSNKLTNWEPTTPFKLLGTIKEVQ